MTDEIDQVFKNFDLDEECYILKGHKLKIRQLSMKDLETLQDAEAEVDSLDGSNLSAKEILQKSRDWDNLIMEIAFGKDSEIYQLKDECTAKEFKQMIAEVFVFLGKFLGVDGAREYIDTLREKQNSLKKTSEP